jgi:ABC-type transport system substrate-binding protein
MANYWDKVLARRVGRRRALAATGATAFSAAFLAACGGDDDDGGTTAATGGTAATGATGGTGATGATGATGSTGAGAQPTQESGLLFTPVDETAQAVPGGLYTGSHPLVLTTLDPMFPGGQIRVARRGYSALFRVTDGILQNSDGSVEGDLAESWELSPDNLTLTIKLYPEAGFAPVDPVNGRPADAEDVLFSWKRMIEVGQLAGELANEVSPAAPIARVTAPDSTTIVMEMVRPDVTIFPNLATEVLGGLYVLAKEAEDQNVIDVQREAIGTGPYYMTEVSEVEYRWKKNPHFKRPALTNGEPFVDEIYEPVITDSAAGTAQFIAGSLLEYGVPATDQIAVKKDNPQLLMVARPPSGFGESLYFGILPDSPFKDERLRIAFMKTIDRQPYLEASYNTDRFASEGIGIDTIWESSLKAITYSGWRLDPSSQSDFPDSYTNFVFDLEEAQKLIEAAGYSTPLEFDNTYAAPSPTSFPGSYYTRAEIFLGMIESSGLWKQNRVLIDYRTEWSSERHRFSKGQFVGTTWGPDTSAPDATSAMFFKYNSAGGYYFGGDATLDDLTSRAKTEFDVDARAELIHEAQRYEAAMMYNEKLGTAGSLALRWPALRNVGVYQGGTNWLGITTPSGLKAWIDTTKPPFA